MNKIVFGGDVKKVTERLEVLAEMHAGQTVSEVAEMFEHMTADQKERYIRLITAEYEQFGGHRENAKRCMR